jgi:hypothetical protein
MILMASQQLFLRVFKQLLNLFFAFFLMFFSFIFIKWYFPNFKTGCTYDVTILYVFSAMVMFFINNVLFGFVPMWVFCLIFFCLLGLLYVYGKELLLEFLLFAYFSDC